ncbi:hypothetical protein RND81_06G088300 [Saponaria officinalis]|uniref:Remorin C-terminal domain-containing protein n=1 Tax=Saponaria officinalis TaxID=3572 RepID=A0AAW1K9M9_SAPOF
MEYQRIDRPQTGIISPSKLRAKLMGLSPTKRKEGSNSHSARTSPARAVDTEFIKNSLLASTSQDFGDPVNLCSQMVSSSVENPNHCQVKENVDAGHIKALQSRRAESNNSSTAHPSKSNDDENLDYDSNASSSSFEFHKGERVRRSTLTRSLSRPTSYKWNDAEKWIMNKQSSQGNYPNGGNRILGMNLVRVAPDVAASYDFRLSSRMPEMLPVDSCQPTEKFSVVHSKPEPVLVDLYPQSKDLMEVSNARNSILDVPSTPAIRAISMRDMGTEMTPATSQEPSRTATPVGAVTPLRTPTSSIPSTPRSGDPGTTIVVCAAESNTQQLTEKCNKDLSEQEMKLKTRREIVALGVQLGKMNIAAWASKDDKEKGSLHNGTPVKELEHMEYENRAAAWEEAEKSKHAAWYKREEIKIQAWESQQKAKLEEELRRIEAKVERLRTQSQAKMMKKIAVARKRSEAKRAAAEAQKRCQAEKTTARAEYIRQTGRIPSRDYVCCGLFS